MFVIKKTGQVPVRSIKRGGRAGIFGVPPAIARAGVLAGEFELVAPAAGHDVVVVADPVKEKPPAPVKEEIKDVVEIPLDWEKRHHLTWINIAQKLIGGPIVVTEEQKAAEIKASKIAKDIIFEELRQRAAAEPPAE